MFFHVVDLPWICLNGQKLIMNCLQISLLVSGIFDILGIPSGNICCGIYRSWLQFSFTNIYGLHLNFVKCEYFLESNSPDILALCAGFELAICNSQFAKRFGSLRKSFYIFCKNCESLKPDTSWIFRVTHWTSYIVSYFKPIKYPLLNSNVISQKFIVHINFKLHTSFFSNYHFVTI